MEKEKLCLIYNKASHYREAIFRAIDTEYDCDWYFGTMKQDIKDMDTSVLKNVKHYDIVGNPDKIFWKRGVLSLLFKKKYRNFFMLIEVRAVSDWIFFWLASHFFRKKKIYLWTHGWYGKESGLSAKMKLWVYKHVAGTFVYSNYARKLLIENGIPKEKVFTIHNSLDYDQQKSIRESIAPSHIYHAHFGNHNPTVIFIGRLTRVKQLDMLVDSIAHLRDKGEYYNLVFIGDGEEKAMLENLAAKDNIKDMVWFYGACYDEKENAELIYNADLCVAPGNVGLTAMHTMVFGTPVVSHDNFKWQMPEFEAIIPGETGDFFNYQNQQSLEDTISSWFRNKSDKREDVRQACYKEIDTQWNPYFQMEVIKDNLKC